MMNQVYTTLPDDRPITAICVVENIDKCPKGFYAVSKTYDQDSDADLWRESGFFGKKITRYLCLSKTEGSAERVVEDLKIIFEKERIPPGYTVPQVTYDTGQKAWRKKKLYFKSGHAGRCNSAVTDIIIMSKMKKPPEEFTFSGEVNGLTLCHKIKKSCQPTLVIPYSIKPVLPAYPTTVESEGNYVNAPTSPSQDYVVLRRAPPPPLPTTTKPVSNYATISGFGGLEGVPFILNPLLNFSPTPGRTDLPMPKTKDEIDEQFNYNFRNEIEQKM